MAESFFVFVALFVVVVCSYGVGVIHGAKIGSASVDCQASGGDSK